MDIIHSSPNPYKQHKPNKSHETWMYNLLTAKIITQLYFEFLFLYYWKKAVYAYLIFYYRHRLHASMQFIILDI